MAVQRDALTWEIQGTTIRFPVWFRDAGAAVAGFVVPLAPVRRMLAASGLRPVGFAGRTLAVLALLDYREHEGNELGSYDEFGLIFVVRAPDGRIGGHIHQLPVSADFTREAGTEFWGYPKWLTDFDLEIGPDRAECRLSANGRALLAMVVRAWALPRLREIPVRIAAYTVRDGRVHRCESRGRVTGVRFRIGGGAALIPAPVRTTTDGHPADRHTADGHPADEDTADHDAKDGAAHERSGDDRRADALPRELRELGLPRSALFTAVIERAELEMFPAVEVPTPGRR